MDRHLVAIEVGVERRTDERMDLNGLTFDENRLERLNTQAVKRRSTVQENRMLPDNVLENVPNDRLLALDHFTGLFDSSRMGVFLELVVNKRLKKLQGHLLWKTA